MCKKKAKKHVTFFVCVCECGGGGDQKIPMFPFLLGFDFFRLHGLPTGKGGERQPKNELYFCWLK